MTSCGLSTPVTCHPIGVLAITPALSATLSVSPRHWTAGQPLTSCLPVNQNLPVDRSTLRDHAVRFAQSNFKLLSLRPCPQHKLGIRCLMRETRDSYPT